MGCTSEIWMWFSNEKHARRAARVAEGMIRLMYAPGDLPWVKEAEKYPTLSGQYLACHEEADAYDINPRYTALEWLRQEGALLHIERCQDVCRLTGIESSGDLVPQLFFACALRYPRVSFTALYRHEMTVSGALQLIRAVYDGSVMHFQEKNGLWPMDEDNWDTEFVYDYVVEDGQFVKK